MIKMFAKAKYFANLNNYGCLISIASAYDNWGQFDSFRTLKELGALIG